MKNLIVISALVASAVGCAGYQAKLDNAQTKAKDVVQRVECRAKVVSPYLDFVLEQDLPAILDGASVEDMLAMSGEAEAEVAKVKAAFAACGKITLK